MHSRPAQILLGILLLSGGFISVSQAEPRPKMSLDGVWNFATDPQNRGEAEKWYRPGAKWPDMPRPGYGANADGKIRVPGIWDNQGYGTETARVHHSFVGKGWYQRQVAIPPSWAGRRLFLTISGVCRYAKVWIDEEFLGEHMGYLSTQEYDVTKHAAPGRTVTITIQVDSKQRWPTDCLFGCSMLADYVDEVIRPDYVDAAWGGIWGHVMLEARAEAWLSDLYVQPDVSRSSCAVSAVLRGKAGLADGARLEVFDPSGRRTAEETVKLDPKLAAGQPVSLTALLPGAKRWTPDTPVLYTARLGLLKGDQPLDAVESRFGMRQFSVDGPHLLLNGERLMLRGYGDDHVYPEQMAMPCDKQLHLKRLRTIKSYGFNHVRHHSTIMPPEYYDACDEVGIISTAEFCICYEEFMPGIGPVWRRHVPAGTSPAAALETYKRQWAAVVRQYRNHPSIICWVMGNELYWVLREPLGPLRPLRDEFQRIAREDDPGRLFMDADGQEAQIMERKNDRGTLAYYSVAFSHYGIDTPDRFKTPRPTKPVISHESGNYITFSRPDLIDRFRHNIKPYWLTAGKAKLETLGLLSEANQWAEKSERLYALCHKYDLEALRKNPYMSGYHWWLFQDYWTTSNGLVDHYFRPKSIAPEEVLKVNSDVVLLQEGLEKTCRAGKRLDVKLLISNYSPEALQGQLIWEVKAGDPSIGERQAAIKEIPQGHVVEVGQIGLELPAVTGPRKLKIRAELVAGGKRFRNDWTAWLYPAAIHPEMLPVPVFADAASPARFRDWDARPLPTEGALSERAVYLVGRFADRRLVDALQRGACVVAFGGVEDTLKFRTLSYGTSWWKGSENGQVNHTGTFVYDHPMTRAMAPEALV